MEGRFVAAQAITVRNGTVLYLYSQKHDPDDVVCVPVHIFYLHAFFIMVYPGCLMMDKRMSILRVP